MDFDRTMFSIFDCHVGVLIHKKNNAITLIRSNFGIFIHNMRKRIIILLTLSFQLQF